MPEPLCKISYRSSDTEGPVEYTVYAARSTYAVHNKSDGKSGELYISYKDRLRVCRQISCEEALKTGRFSDGDALARQVEEDRTTKAHLCILRQMTRGIALYAAVIAVCCGVAAFVFHGRNSGANISAIVAASIAGFTGTGAYCLHIKVSQIAVRSVFYQGCLQTHHPLASSANTTY